MSAPPTLTENARAFILHWGEMGTRWGVNRTVAQIHALLYLSPEPLHAEQIAALVGVTDSTAHRRYQSGLDELRKTLEAPWPREENNCRSSKKP